MFLKLVFGTTVALGGASIVSPTFRHKLDRNIIRPVRDYNMHLNSWNDFKTEEDFLAFLSEFGHGIRNMFKVEDV